MTAQKFINSTTPSPPQKGETLNVDFGNNAPSKFVVSINDKVTTNYTYNDGVLKIENVNGNVIIDANLKYEFNYTGR